MKLILLTALLWSGCSTLSKGQAGPDYKVLAVSYTDSTGLYWLEKLDDDLANGCLDKNGNYHFSLCTNAIETGFDSAAEETCEMYGARLPTIVEYRELLRDFQPSADLAKGLNSETYHEVAMAFKDDLTYAAWTSTVNPDNQAQAAYFSWRRGEVSQRFEYRSVPLPVRCVRKP